jgi:hypothetical protein
MITSSSFDPPVTIPHFPPLGSAIVEDEEEPKSDSLALSLTEC